MKQLSRQLEAWATDLKTSIQSNMFIQARLKLTFLYVIFLAIILAAFSLFLYNNLSSNISSRHDENFVSIESQSRYAHEENEDLRDVIVSSDLFILLLASFLSYVLAGKTLKPINESMLRQKRFSADASHELRTPLAAIKIQNEVLLRNKSRTTEMVEDILRNTVEEVDRMSSITDSLLLLARANGQASPHFERLDLAGVLDKSKERLASLADKKGISVSLVSMSQGVHVDGNEEFLGQAFLNIIQNSLDHTKEGGSLNISLSVTSGSSLISIEDNGEGIDPKHLPHLFEPFYKVDYSRGLKKGNGLGLAIVEEIIRLHRGKISISSVLGKGTVAKIELPLSSRQA